MSACGYLRIYLAVYHVYGPGNKGGFGLEEKMKAVCGLRRKTMAVCTAECATPYNRPSKLAWHFYLFIRLFPSISYKTVSSI